MTASEDEEKNYEARFLALVSSLSNSVMQHLGKVMNPLTGKIERNLQGAKETIEFLRMLREKTKGNLTDREETTLRAFLSTLQLNYLDEVEAEAEKPKEKPEEKKKEERPEEKPPPPAEDEKLPEQKEAAEEQKEAPVEEKSEQRPAKEAQPPEEKTAKGRKTGRSKPAAAEE